VVRFIWREVFKGEYVVRSDEVTGNGENYIMKSLVICTCYGILCEM